MDQRSSETSYHLFVSGHLGPKESGKLKALEAQDWCYAMTKKTAKKKRGPVADRVKIKGDWSEAMKKAPGRRLAPST